MCLLANRIFVLSSQKLLGIKPTLSSKRRHCLVTRRLLDSAGARSALMRMRTQCLHVLAFFVRPGALGRLNEVGKSFHEMKGG